MNDLCSKLLLPNKHDLQAFCFARFEVKQILNKFKSISRHALSFID